MKKIVSNFLYQGIFQIFSMLMPLITVPIVSKALGPTNIGIYNFTLSIINYFVLFSTLGIGLYGQRTIALLRADKDAMSKSFWEIVILKFITTSCTLIVLSILLLFLPHKIFFLIQTLIIVGNMLDISWFFAGIEEFKKMSIRSLSIKTITLVLIILFINDPSDIYLYVFIQAFGILLSQLVMWPFLKSKIHFVKVKANDILFHLREGLTYFLPQMTILIFTNINVTLLGVFSTKQQVGYYSNANVLATIAISLFSVMDTILLPRLTNMFSNSNKSGMYQLLSKSLNWQLYFSIPAMFGVMMISYHLIPWFYGNEFLDLRLFVPILSVQVVINLAAMSISRQFLIPIGDMKTYNFSIVLAVIIGICINLLFTPFFGIWGTITATISSQVFLLITRTYGLYKTTPVRYDLKTISKWFIISLSMYIIGQYFSAGMKSTPLTTITQIIFGILYYIVITSILKVNPFFSLIMKRIELFRIKSD
ncbi:oligosaccharide flippase family protein [Enterococcus casseliflavus]|uniref:oligosaccharide flippase family protein n=1 Tax=Enterococcus casseliflavus TaxID=37734 RepID=UPI00191B236E|nr:oligosaccharide flippase family protein [Enterococcus casseliflavus]MDV7712265.1 oligosaccharide flippase family protein [Enterococcus casseliflavus]QQU15549.1 oligosaccharide flippase family protein [Enterococcus casseliflavus]